MSADTYEYYKAKFSDEVAAEADARAAKIRATRAASPSEGRRAGRGVDGLYDEASVRRRLTKPAPGVSRVHIFAIDNSGSNRAIAEHLKKSSGYLIATLESIDPEAQYAFVYFSDHCDGPLWRQDIDYVFPNKEGDRSVYSTLSHTKPAGGGDEAEAIECVLWELAEADFGDATERHLYLVTDVVAHGMGLSNDDGCRLQRDWWQALDRARAAFTSISVVGCSAVPKMGVLQEQFLTRDRVGLDLIDLSSISDVRHRMGITGNALLFLVARSRGWQTVEMFLGFLYAKWLEDPVFGANTDLRAREAIRAFGKYLEAPQEKIEALLAKVLVE